jgi:hypothetical protein
MNDDIRERREMAIDELRDMFYNDPEKDLDDDIFELADQSVPVYTSDLLEAAAAHIDFAVNEPELGPAFDGSPTPVNIIASNIFDYFNAELWEEYYRLQEEFKEAKDEAYAILHNQMGEFASEHGALNVETVGPWTLVAYMDEEGDEVCYLQAGEEYERVEL